MDPRICVICGDKFIPTNPRQKMCNKEHWHPCPNCGKLVLARSPNDINKCCCRKCGQAIAQKKRDNNFKSQGVSSLRDIQDQKVYHKICKYCGKPFDTYNARQVYCSEDYYNCPICGKLVKIKKDRSNIGAACSKECKQKRTEQTCLEKYGNKIVLNSNYGRTVAKHHNLENYGVEVAQQSQSYKDHYRQTMLDRYDVEYPLQNGKILEKAKQTIIEHYGVDNPMKSEGIKEKAIKTSYERYGSEFWLSSRDMYIKAGLSDTQITLWNNFKDDPKTFLINLNDTHLSFKKLYEMFGTGELAIQQILHDNNLYYYIDDKHSGIENEVYDFVSSEYSGKIIRNDRSAINPQELDIYLPDIKFAIEVNPTYTHNSSLPSFQSDKSLPYTYHIYKTKACEDVGIRLFHVWGYDWHNHNRIVKSMIRSAIHSKNIVRIYARNLNVKTVDYKPSISFLNENHLKGVCSSKYRYGLYDKDELVSLMTFGSERSTQGLKSDDVNTIELLRFCSKLNYQIVGGASKLFKYALNDMTHRIDLQKIVSFSDRATTSGNLYDLLGFHKVSESDPGYVWVNSNNDSYFTRVQCQKRNLSKLFNEDIDTSNLTERQIMESHGYVRVFDSGVIRWEYEL